MPDIILCAARNQLIHVAAELFSTTDFSTLRKGKLNKKCDFGAFTVKVTVRFKIRVVVKMTDHGFRIRVGVRVRVPAKSARC